MAGSGDVVGKVDLFDRQLLNCILLGEDTMAKRIFEKSKHSCIKTDSQGATLLHFSAMYGNAVMAKYFINLGCAIDAKDNRGSTPLRLAVKNNHVEVMKVLLEAKADMYESDNGESLLQTIMKSYIERRETKRNRNLARILSKRLKRDFKSNEKMVMKKLLEANCPLYLAVKLLENAKVIEYYEAGSCVADAHEPTTGCTPLHYAVRSGDYKTVQMLVEKDMDVNVHNHNKETPLFYYNNYSDRNVEMLEYFLDQGASLTSANNSGDTPLEELLMHACNRTVRSILRRGIDMRTKYRDDSTALHFLACNRHKNIMRDLKGKKLAVNAPDKNGSTPLMFAVLSGNMSSVKYLLKKGADVSASNAAGVTPLRCAVYRATCRSDKSADCKYTRIGMFLLKKGADIQHAFRDQTTIFHWISRSERFELSKHAISLLVLNESFGQPIKPRTRMEIQSDRRLEDQYNFYHDQMGKMKATVVHESLTLFDLLTMKDDELMLHAIDFEFITKLEHLKSNYSDKGYYYYNLLHKRMIQVMSALNVEMRSELAPDDAAGCNLL